jgi:hypothetical protein
MSGIFSSKIGFLAVVVVVFNGLVLLDAVVLLVDAKAVFVAGLAVIVLLDAGGLQSKFTPSLIKH